MTVILIPGIMGRMQSPMERFARFLEGRGRRLTGRRRLVADAFFRAGGHLSAEELARLAKEHDAGVGTATVYRTLNLLKEAGLASGLSGGPAPRYEPPSSRGHHDHAICRACGRIEEFADPRIEELQARVAERLGFAVADHRLEIYGLCAACRRPGRAAR